MPRPPVPQGLPRREDRASAGLRTLGGFGGSVVVVVAGHVTQDRARTAGGPAFHAARTHRGLGAATRLVSAVGADFACDAALDGIHAELRRGAGATTSIDGTRLLARAEPVLAVDLPEAWRRCDL